MIPTGVAKLSVRWRRKLHVRHELLLVNLSLMIREGRELKSAKRTRGLDMSLMLSTLIDLFPSTGFKLLS